MGSVLFLLSLALILAHILWYSWHYGISPSPTSSKVKKKLFKAMPVPNPGKIMELGSGWGNVAFALARHFPYYSIEAYEISPLPYLISKIGAYLLAYPNLNFIRRDFFTISLREASLVVCYLYPGAMQRLKVKFEEELLPGAFVLSHTFAVPGWTPLHLCYADDLYRTPIFVYQIVDRQIKLNEKPTREFEHDS